MLAWLWSVSVEELFLPWLPMSMSSSLCIMMSVYLSMSLWMDGWNGCSSTTTFAVLNSVGSLAALVVGVCWTMPEKRRLVLVVVSHTSLPAEKDCMRSNNTRKVLSLAQRGLGSDVRYLFLFSCLLGSYTPNFSTRAWFHRTVLSYARPSKILYIVQNYETAALLRLTTGSEYGSI